MIGENTIESNLGSGWRQLVHEWLLKWATVAFFFLLPLQTRFFLREAPLYEWGTLSLYGVEILGWLVILLAIPFLKKFSIFNFQFSILALPLLGLLSIFWAPDRLVALQTAVRLAEGVLLYCILCSARIHPGLGDAKASHYMFYAFLSGAALQALLGISQFLTQSTFSSAWLGMALHDPATLGTAVVEAGGVRWLRAYGGLPHPNVFGGYLAVVLVFTLHMINRINISKRQRYWLLAISYLLLTGIFFSFSRAAWAAAGLVLIFGMIRKFREYNTFARTSKSVIPGFALVYRATVAYLLFLAFYFGLLVIVFRPLVVARIIPSDTQRLEIKSRVERVAGVREAWTLIQSHPVLGVGIGNYTQGVAHEVRPGQPLYSYQPVHSVPLLVWAELGTVGLLLFFAALRQIFKQSKFFIFHFSFFILFLFDHYLWSLPFGILLFWAILGLSAYHPQGGT